MTMNTADVHNGTFDVDTSLKKRFRRGEKRRRGNSTGMGANPIRPQKEQALTQDYKRKAGMLTHSELTR